jgi:hypothetical protein
MSPTSTRSRAAPDPETRTYRGATIDETRAAMVENPD